MITLLIVFLMLSGILMGFFIFSRGDRGGILRVVGHVQPLAAAALLFAMGIWLGGNPEFWDNLETTGLYGLMFAAATVAGSVASVFFASKLLKKGEKD